MTRIISILFTLFLCTLTLTLAACAAENQENEAYTETIILDERYTIEEGFYMQANGILTYLHENIPQQPMLVNESARQIVEEFLSVYLSAFSIGFVFYDGTYRDFSLNELSERPLVVWDTTNEHPRNVYYDRLGNRIEDAPFLYNGGFFIYFTLYNLNDGDMPTIVMRWVLPETCATFREVWRFIDGEYRNTGRLMGWYSLFYNPDGNLIVLYDDVMGGPMAYYFLTFTDNGLEHESIIDASNLDWDDWANHHWNDEFAMTPTIIGTGIALTPVQRLTELENEITKAVRLKHGI